MLKTQIKAIYRASIYGNCRLMFPMINDTDEIEEIRKIIGEVKEELDSSGVKYREIPIGIMVETPSSVILLDRISEYIDFISVGTNDLIQYTLAIDRGNMLVASDFDPSHPAILRSLKSIAEISKKSNLDMSICGEMAGDPLYTLLLIGLGYRKLSMSVMNIPLINNIICNSTIEEAKKISERALSLISKKEIHKFLTEEMTGRFEQLEDYFRENV